MTTPTVGDILAVHFDGGPEPTHHEVSPARLSSADLRAEQQSTLAAPRRTYGWCARMLFKTMDLFYGRERSLSKFKVLELIARVPYQAWEVVAYLAVTHRYSRPAFARRVHKRVNECRAQQDNEQWHLLILEELVGTAGCRESFVRYRLLPQFIALVYYQLSRTLYVLKPAWSYRLNADFEDHAEHEYALFVEENPHLEMVGYDGLFCEEYGRFDSLADLFRQIGHDERVHKEESVARLDSKARFS